MRPWLLVPLAFKALRRNVMRTILTMLGIVIGVSAVICIVAIGDGREEFRRNARAHQAARRTRAQADQRDRRPLRQHECEQHESRAQFAEQIADAEWTA
jgi:hypothetical protein